METRKKDYLTCAETAKLLRTSLKNSFPAVKFTVKSKTYAGGASIDVGYKNGPTAKEVEKVAKLYAGATFDGMQDLKEYHDTLLVGNDGQVQQVSMGADFVFVGRSVDLEFKAALVEAVNKFWGLDLALDQWGCYPYENGTKLPVGYFWRLESAWDFQAQKLDKDVWGYSAHLEAALASGIREGVKP